MTFGTPLLAKLTALVSLPLVTFSYCAKKVGFENIKECFDSNIEKSENEVRVEAFEIETGTTESFIATILENYRLIGL